MKVKLSTVIMSHSSDAKIEVTMLTHTQRVVQRLNFISYLVLNHKNLDKMIDPDVEFSKFQKNHPQLAQMDFQD